MRAIYAAHIVTGGIGLVAGFTALYAAKGASLHRRSGMAFVWAMLAMCVAGGSIAIVRGVSPAVNIPSAVLTSYMVITALITLRPSTPCTRRLSVVLAITALTVGLASLSFAYEALASPDGTRKGMPAFPFLLFGIVGTLAGVLDVRVMRSAPLVGAPRLARHLWRMSFALFVAALAFFIGQARVIPEPIRIRPLLALPVLAVLVTMLYWLWRVRVRRSLRGLALVGAARAA